MEIEKVIEIEASAEKIYDILTDFKYYGEWNPLVRKVSGRPIVGQKLNIVITMDGESTQKMETEVVVNDRNRHLRWVGIFFFTWLFRGEHFFMIEPQNSSHTCIFRHGEKLTGILVPLLRWFYGEKLPRAYANMNSAIKMRAEGSDSM